MPFRPPKREEIACRSRQTPLRQRRRPLRSATRAAGPFSACWSSACSSSCSTTRCSTSRCGRSPIRCTVSARARASSSGRSTPTPWSSPVCCSPGASSATGSAAAACCSPAWSCSASRRSPSAYAQTPDQLICARALMGIGGAAVMPATLSIISNVFDPRERGKAIGVWAGAVGLGVAIGPVVGGALLEHFWWGSVFLINVPIVVIGVIADPRGSCPSRATRSRAGSTSSVSLLSIVGLIALVYGIIDGGDHGFGRHPVVGLDHRRRRGAGRVRGVGAAHRRSRRWTCGCSATRGSRPRSASVGLVFFAAMGTLFFIAFYLQLVRGYSPLQSRPAVDAVRGRAADLRAAERRAWCAGSDRRRSARSGSRWSRWPCSGSPRLGAHTPIWVLGVLLLRPGRRHGQRDAAGDRVDHGVAAAGEGRRRLGDQQHGPAGRRRARRRGPRFGAVRRSTASRIGDHLGAVPAGQRGRRRRLDLGDLRCRGEPAAHGQPAAAGR